MDVTEARKRISRLKKRGSPVSFTAWMVKCIADAVQRHPLVHGVKKGKRNIVTFTGADISIMVEKEIGSVRVPVPYIIREANNKSIPEIYDELRRVKEQRVNDEGDYVPGGGYSRPLMNLYYSLPGFVRRLFWRIVLSSPVLVKRFMGSVIVTSVGMAGRINGWVVPRSVHPLCIAASTVIAKPGVSGNRIAVREYLPLTILLDHDVIDGAPAVRVMSELIESMESAFLL